MHKKILSISVSVLSTMLFTVPSYALESKKEAEIFRLSDNDVLSYPESASPLIQTHNKNLLDQKVDLGKAMGLSALYFGVGQMYAGDKNRGAWIMGGGTVLLAGTFLWVLPRFANRQASVTAAASTISFSALALAYLWNIRDAYNVAEKNNANIEKQLLISDNLLNKFSFSTQNDTLKLGYDFSSF